LPFTISTSIPATGAPIWVPLAIEFFIPWISGLIKFLGSRVGNALVLKALVSASVP